MSILPVSHARQSHPNPAPHTKLGAHLLATQVPNRSRWSDRDGGCVTQMQLRRARSRYTRTKVWKDIVASHRASSGTHLKTSALALAHAQWPQIVPQLPLPSLNTCVPPKSSLDTCMIRDISPPTMSPRSLAKAVLTARPPRILSIQTHAPEHSPKFQSEGRSMMSDHRMRASCSSDVVACPEEGHDMLHTHDLVYTIYEKWVSVLYYQTKKSLLAIQLGPPANLTTFFNKSMPVC
jgi:predicted dienelactone hydrolase